MYIDAYLHHNDMVISALNRLFHRLQFDIMEAYMQYIYSMCSVRKDGVKYRKSGHFSRWLRPDWDNTGWVATAKLGYRG